MSRLLECGHRMYDAQRYCRTCKEVKAIMLEWSYKCTCGFRRNFGKSRVSMEMAADRHHLNHPDKSIIMYRPDGNVWQTIEPAEALPDLFAFLGNEESPF